MSKSKGGRYELEFARAVQGYGLPALKVPLSGAMNGYPGDVCVCDEVLVECKYRRDGAGFKTLYRWMDETGADVLVVEGDGVELVVFTLEKWCDVTRSRIDTGEALYTAKLRTSSNSWAQLQAWIQDCAALAVRMPRRKWLVIEMEVNQ